MTTDFSIPDDVGSVALSDTCRLCGKTFHQPAGMILHGLLPSPDSRFPMHIGCWRRASGLDENRPSRSWPAEVRAKLEPSLTGKGWKARCLGDTPDDRWDAYRLMLSAIEAQIEISSTTTIRAVAHYKGPPPFIAP